MEQGEAISGQIDARLSLNPPVGTKPILRLIRLQKEAFVLRIYLKISLGSFFRFVLHKLRTNPVPV